MLPLWLARCLSHFVGWKLSDIEALAPMLLLRTLTRSKASQQTTLLKELEDGEIGPDWG
jgi:hypothetical protein